jgi:hypothetical protein
VLEEILKQASEIDPGATLEAAHHSFQWFIIKFTFWFFAILISLVVFLEYKERKKNASPDN